MVPYGQAMHSPDHASCVTVRSQGLSLIEKNSIEIGETYGHVPRSVMFLARSGDRRERGP